MSEDSANKDEIKWGAEIAVNGKRPEWLAQDDTRMWYRCLDGYTCDHPAYSLPASHDWWSRLDGDRIVAIRLPADHPYYAQGKADEAFAAKLLDADVRGVMRRRERQEDAATTAIDPALVERAFDLVRLMASNDGAAFVFEYKDTARDILKALEPVDPDEAIAEEIAASFNEGEHEAIALAALKRGRQLERGEK